MEWKGRKRGEIKRALKSCPCARRGRLPLPGRTARTRPNAGTDSRHLHVSPSPPSANSETVNSKGGCERKKEKTGLKALFHFLHHSVEARHSFSPVELFSGFLSHAGRQIQLVVGALLHVLRREERRKRGDHHTTSSRCVEGSITHARGKDKSAADFDIDTLAFLL